ncbi:MAG: hypothetical protein Q4P18_02525 [Methanobrevibacter sp.]|uniref:hypothetical protein n=1 Tax=Methanobrevibacter sp. TaxID=66852 RepID=UPI0026E103CF|nr:hypothetical protein [Methanobrevibacter sp.]MDO5848387.1 hypothetical protein [Methanobrevibacter sp.]
MIIVAYVGYMFMQNDNSDDISTTGKNISTINESDPNGTNNEISTNYVDYQSYENDYGGSQASSSGSTSSP